MSSSVRRIPRKQRHPSYSPTKGVSTRSKARNQSSITTKSNMSAVNSTPSSPLMPTSIVTSTTPNSTLASNAINNNSLSNIGIIDANDAKHAGTSNVSNVAVSVFVVSVAGDHAVLLATFQEMLLKHTEVLEQKMRLLTPEGQKAQVEAEQSQMRKSDKEYEIKMGDLSRRMCVDFDRIKRNFSHIYNGVWKSASCCDSNHNDKTCFDPAHVDLMKVIDDMTAHQNTLTQKLNKYKDRYEALKVSLDSKDNATVASGKSSHSLALN